jgi:TPR repeat protein
VSLPPGRGPRHQVRRALTAHLIIPGFFRNHPADRRFYKDDTAAVAWCEHAAVAGDAHACINMAHVLAGGLVGRAPDRRAARRWLDLARRKGHASDARDTAVSSLVAAPLKPVPSLAPGLPPTSPKYSRVLPTV